MKGFKMLGVTLCLPFLWFISLPAFAQFAPDPMAAGWIADEEANGKAAKLLYFRKALTLNTLPDSFPVRVSADNRFRLYVNGEFVASGPEHSDLDNWRTESLDLSPYLQSGENVIAVKVWNWGALKPESQLSLRTGLFIEGLNDAASVLDSNGSWRVKQDEALSFIPVSGQEVGGYYAAPPGESIHGSSIPNGWMTTGFNDGDWQDAVKLRLPMMNKGDNPFGAAFGWQLTDGILPQMEESPVRYGTIRKSDLTDVSDAFLAGDAPLTLAANATHTLLLDQTHLTNAYPVLNVSGGKGSEIKLIYAESLKYSDGTKGNRNTLEGEVTKEVDGKQVTVLETKQIKGVTDKFYPSGADNEILQTLWFRTYRYVQVEVTTAGEPLTINDIHGIFTGYPLELNASFSSDAKWLDNVWDINWRTIRLCAYDMYFDTPYYEQLQYVGDTRIQSLISLYMSGDDRLMRQAIEAYANSMSSEGITTSRYPSDLAQYIPPFSLVWVMMVNDYRMYRGDDAWLKPYLPKIRSVLTWFENRLNDDGLVGKLSWWPFMDWVPEWERGIPPGGQTGGSAMITLQFAYALQQAAALESDIGVQGQADVYSALADELIATVNKLAWDADAGLYRDIKDEAVFSEQTNTLAVLTGAVKGEKAAQVLDKALHDDSLSKATFYFQFYVFEALYKSGLGDQYLEHLAPWQTMLDNGLTSTPENPDPTRSDSHAWSAHPNYGFLSIILGIRPASPGFETVRIAPALGELKHAEGVMPHPLGDIKVSLKQNERGELSGSVTLPEGLAGEFDWHGKQMKLKGGKQDIAFSH